MKKQRTYTNQQCMKILGLAPYPFHHHVVSGLVRRIGRNCYDANDVDLLKSARTNGLHINKVAKVLKVPKKHLTVLIELGFLHKIIPRYKKSNFMPRSVDIVRKQLEKNGYYEK